MDGHCEKCQMCGEIYLQSLENAFEKISNGFYICKYCYISYTETNFYLNYENQDLFKTDLYELNIVKSNNKIISIKNIIYDIVNNDNFNVKLLNFDKLSDLQLINLFIFFIECDNIEYDNNDIICFIFEFLGRMVEYRNLKIIQKIILHFINYDRLNTFYTCKMNNINNKLKMITIYLSLYFTTNNKNRIIEILLHFNQKYKIFDNNILFKLFIEILADNPEYIDYNEHENIIFNQLNIDDDYISTFIYTLKKIKNKNYNVLTNNIIQTFQNTNKTDYNFESKNELLKKIKLEVENKEIL
jgi:hypothetical protein